MSYSYNNYLNTENSIVSNISSCQLDMSNIIAEENSILPRSTHSYESGDYMRAPRVHINRNSLLLSGSVYINKNKFNVNQTAHSVIPSVDHGTTCVSDGKIHYNPKFFKSNQNSVNVSNTKNIHINPFFTKTIEITSPINHPSNSEFQSSDSINFTDTNKKEHIHFNPKFVKNVELRDDSVNETSLVSNHLPLSVDVFQPEKQVIVQPSCSRMGFNSKYCKVNKISQRTVKQSPKISKYKLRRNNEPERTPLSNYSLSLYNESPKSFKLPMRKPRLSGSFKKIGKRKLVRKSLIQSYISSRRNSLPSMIQHSRNTLASRKKLKLVSKSKFKLVRSITDKRSGPSFKAPKYKAANVSPMKSKFKWSRTKVNGANRSQDFIKFGKRKIVRKSILQSILEARRRCFYNSTKYSPNKKYSCPKSKIKMDSVPLRSRYKVIRSTSSIATRQLNQSNKFEITERSTNKKSALGSISHTLMSKSILYRMPPNLRFKMKMAEKRKQLMLLKKVNNRKKCLFYNRFGHCKGLDEGTCKKIHDPKLVSVCKKFLKGSCDGEGCILSHQVVPEKMPTCHQFLAGVCVRINCPFLHVKLSHNRPICNDFLQGFCQLGDLCSKRHQFICPEWDENGTCKTEKCSYPHPSINSKEKQQNADKSIVTFKPKQIKRLRRGSDKSNCTADTAEDVNSRYFSADNDKLMTASVLESENSNPIERKPDLKDGSHSVYDRESLLTFIPFS